MLEKLEVCFDLLQNLNIQPTLGNMEKLVQVLYNLREVYDGIRKENTDAGENRATADPGQPDD